MNWSTPLILLAALGVSAPALAAPATDAACMGCHDATSHAEASEKAGVDAAEYRRSVHAKLTCVECHKDAKGDSCKQGLAKVDCSSCHAKQAASFAASAHAGVKTKDGASVGCTDCHGTHETLGKKAPKSSVYPTEQPKTCGKCHDSDKKTNGKKSSFHLDEYLKSTHWLGMTKSGLSVSASCVSCHGSHDMRAKTDSKSLVNRANQPKTCGKCHEGMAEKYLAGIHGQALLRGSADTPVCTDCHGDHGIRDHEDPKSSVFASTVSKTTCPQCHAGEYINRRYGIPRGQVESYAQTFHGLADQFGDTKVANCASCHGAHEILPPSDPKSSVNAANLPKTCGGCHPGAGPNFARGGAHHPDKAEGAAVLGWVRFIYIGLIAATLSGMFLHNALDYYATLRERMRENRGKRRYQRFNVSERLQHFVLVATFVVLAFTGFALQYPDAFWVKPLIHSGFGFLARSYAHRVAAIIFVIASAYHVYYLASTARGREQAKAMMPGKKDLGDLWHQLRYFVGLEQKPGHFQRYSYAEKVEYLALIWGSIVMVVTGLILWFEEGALAWLPKWGWDLADLVHLFEAWLATMSILVWHLYHVAFKPSGHGVSLVMATGELTEEEMHHEHPAELETLPRSSALEPDAEEQSNEAPHGKGNSLQTV